MRDFSVEVGFLEDEVEGLGWVVAVVGVSVEEEIDELPFLFLVVVPFGVEDSLRVNLVLSFLSGTSGCAISIGPATDSRISEAARIPDR